MPKYIWHSNSSIQPVFLSLHFRCQYSYHFTETSWWTLRQEGILSLPYEGSRPGSLTHKFKCKVRSQLTQLKALKVKLNQLSGSRSEDKLKGSLGAYYFTISVQVKVRVRLRGEPLRSGLRVHLLFPETLSAARAIGYGYPCNNLKEKRDLPKLRH